MTAADQPGLDARRLVRLMESAVERCQLDLSRRTVLTEAASGAYVVTPVLAALAGADVYALAAGTSYATAGELAALTSGLARLAGVADRVQAETGGALPQWTVTSSERMAAVKPKMEIPMAATTRKPSTPGSMSLIDVVVAAATAWMPNVKGSPSPGCPRTGHPRAGHCQRQT